MCGIVGYLGSQSAVPILINCLKQLEYRGYDSAGITLLNGDDLTVAKSAGKISFLENMLQEEGIPESHVGIGHTRWATQVRSTDLNSPPDTGCTSNFSVVHNGIIENYQAIKEWLQKEGHSFVSETDAEVLPHLVEHFYQGDLETAVLEVINRVEGSYAMMVFTHKEPRKLVAARKDSPLIVGLGEKEYFLASDMPAILSYTRQAYILEDGEVAVLKPEGAHILDRQGLPVDKAIFKVEWDAASAEKAGYDHFMRKEMHEQPRALKDTLSSRISLDNRYVQLNEVSLTPQQIKDFTRIKMVGCGTAYHAGIVGKYLIEKLVRIPVEVDIASEFRYRDPLLDERTLVVVISQSGETADTLAALREAKRKGARVLAVTNVVGSSISREADDVLYTWAGPEIAVASTKAYTTQLICMYLLGLYLAQVRRTLSEEEIATMITHLRQLPQQVQMILNREQQIKKLAETYTRSELENIFFIGRGLDYAVAMEGSLKLKEITYIHAEAYAAGELKHGTFALIEEGFPIIALGTQESLLEKTVNNVKELKARGATVIGLALEGDTQLQECVDEIIHLPRTHNDLTSILAVIPLQLLAYYAAVTRGTNVDQPRNLTKAVTVE